MQDNSGIEKKRNLVTCKGLLLPLFFLFKKQLKETNLSFNGGFNYFHRNSLLVFIGKAKSTINFHIRFSCYLKMLSKIETLRSRSDRNQF